MSETNAHMQISTIDEVLSQLPKEYTEIDEEFLTKYENEIDSLKSIFKDKGGIHLISVEEYSVICRVPSREIFLAVNKRAASLDAMSADFELVKKCILYPAPEIVKTWMDNGNSGIATPIAKQLMKLSKITQEGSAKKL